MQLCTHPDSYHSTILQLYELLAVYSSRGTTASEYWVQGAFFADFFCGSMRLLAVF